MMHSLLFYILFSDSAMKCCSFVLVFLLSFYCSLIISVVCSNPGSPGSCVLGNGVDYSPLYNINGGEDYESTLESFTYYVRICGPISTTNFGTTTVCSPSLTPSVCVYDAVANAAYAFAYWTGPSEYTSLVAIGDTQLTLTSENGSPDRTPVTYDITCGADSNSMTVSEQMGGLVITITTTLPTCTGNVTEPSRSQLDFIYFGFPSSPFFLPVNPVYQKSDNIYSYNIILNSNQTSWSLFAGVNQGTFAPTLALNTQDNAMQFMQFSVELTQDNAYKGALAYSGLFESQLLKWPIGQTESVLILQCYGASGSATYTITVTMNDLIEFN